MPSFRVNHVAVTEILKPNISLRGAGGKARGAGLGHLLGFQQRGSHSSSSWAQSVHGEEEAAALVGRSTPSPGGFLSSVPLPSWLRSYPTCPAAFSRVREGSPATKPSPPGLHTGVQVPASWGRGAGEGPFTAPSVCSESVRPSSGLDTRPGLCLGKWVFPTLETKVSLNCWCLLRTKPHAGRPALLSRDTRDMRTPGWG